MENLERRCHGCSTMIPPRSHHGVITKIGRKHGETVERPWRDRGGTVERPWRKLRGTLEGS